MMNPAEPIGTPGVVVEIYRRKSKSTVRLVIGAYYRRGSQGGRVFELVEVTRANPAKNHASTAKVRYLDRKDGALATLYAGEIGPRMLSPLEILSAQA